jgi:metal-dependent amidase/aminoacylase/carboxypeptidase family protein
MHVTWLAGATKLLARAPDAWHGTLISLFQPAEELGTGAQAMIDDHLFDRFPKPDVILGQHVMPPSAGRISYRPGVTQSEEDNIEVRLFGRGGHGAWPAQLRRRRPRSVAGRDQADRHRGGNRLRSA